MAYVVKEDMTVKGERGGHVMMRKGSRDKAASAMIDKRLGKAMVAKLLNSGKLEKV